MSNKLVLIDGHSIMHRAFYGLPDLTNHEGIHTGAIYGFLNIMFKIMDEEKPTNIAVAFDLHHPTFRHEMFAEYKGNRSPMPEELRSQIPLIKDILKTMNVLVMEKPGLEADDILGTMANKAQKEGADVALISGDRDLLQVATDKIKIRIPKSSMNGKTTIEDYYAKDVKEKYEVTPEQFIDMKALMGDSSDNYPGLPRVGKETAKKLIVQFGSIDNIYERIDEIDKKALKQTFIDNKDLAYLCKKLATIKLDADIPYSFEETKMQDMFNSAAYDMFRNLDLKNLLSRFDDKAALHAEDNSPSYETVNVTNNKEFKDLENALSKLDSDNIIGLKVYTHISKTKGEEAGGQLSLFDVPSETNAEGYMTLCFNKDSCYLVDLTAFDEGKIKDLIIGLISKGVRIATSKVKKLYSYLNLQDKKSRDIGKEFADVIIGAYLINPLKNDYEVADIYKEYLGIYQGTYAETVGKEDIVDAFKSENKDKAVKYALDQAYGIYNSYELIYNKLKEQGMDKLFEEIEMPLSYVLYAMEKEGVLVNRAALRKYGEDLGTGIDELEKKIYAQAGHEFNINSPKQLGEILFEEMKIEGGKKTKTGYSTAADVLSKLAPDYPIVNDILEYRTLTKLKSTYADGLDNYIESDGRIHTSFNQTITATGRISSTEPNLQNIPMRMELGRQIRKVFIPKDGCLFTDADYSQIELRILASMSGDQELIKSYQENVDIHKTTASKVFHVPVEEVTDLMRRNAKAVNFGIVYGISSFGLSEDLSISRADAKKYIEDYFVSFPGIKDFLDNAKKFASENGYSVTDYGRRRPIPEIKSSNFMQRSFGERVAMNAPIQGTAADIMKIAMINVFDALLDKGLKSRIILQVHDELVIETLEDEKDTVAALLEDKMKNAADMAVSLEVSLSQGKDWYEAK